MDGAETQRPQPPQALAGESLDEWHRICGELDKLGFLNLADRAMITIYCQVWQANQEAARHVAQYGAIVRFNNGVIGQSPQFKTQQETARLLIGLLGKLGMSPAARDFDQGKSDDAGTLEF